MLWVMRCPSCQAADTKVVDSREAEEGAAIRRRRVCESCGERFTTFERSESARIQVIKRDGSREEFDRRKLAGAIAKAATEELTPDRIGALIDDLEQTIRQSGTSEVASHRIGEMVLERLAQRDPMSYVRFKIVYDRIADPDALLQEVDTLLRKRAEARDRLVAEQIALPIGGGAAPASRARRRR
jgi:transcriptional repressor NrdR